MEWSECLKQFKKNINPKFKVLAPKEIYGKPYDVEYVFSNKNYMQSLSKRWPKLKTSLEKLIDLKNAPTKSLLNIFVKDITIRRRLEFQDELASKTFAEQCAFLMPTESYESLIQKASSSDAEAILVLGDVFMYGLMQQTLDKAKAVDFYKRASDLGQPEAMTALALHLKFVLYQDWHVEQKYEYSIDTSFTINMESDDFEEFWRLLEQAASLDWISPFLLQEARDCLELNTHALSTNLANIVSRQEEIDKQNKLQHTHKCSNAQCTIRTSHEANLIKCSRCKVAKYCSKSCQAVDWQRGHKDTCTEANEDEAVVTTSTLSKRATNMTELDFKDFRTNEPVQMVTKRSAEQIKDIQNKFNQINYCGLDVDP